MEAAPKAAKTAKTPKAPVAPKPQPLTASKAHCGRSRNATQEQRTAGARLIKLTSDNVLGFPMKTLPPCHQSSPPQASLFSFATSSPSSPQDPHYHYKHDQHHHNLHHHPDQCHHHDSPHRWNHHHKQHHHHRKKFNQGTVVIIGVGIAAALVVTSNILGMCLHCSRYLSCCCCCGRCCRCCWCCLCCCCCGFVVDLAVVGCGVMLVLLLLL